MASARSLGSTARPAPRSTFGTRARALASGVAAAALLVVPTRDAAAQAGNYPAFQPPVIVDREFNFGVGHGDDATSVVFQWREGISSVSQLSLDAGFMDPGGNGDVKLLLGGGFARQLTRSTTDMPLDLLFTAGAYIAATDPTFFQIPIGLVVGHRFPLEGQLALTPYIHPRVALEYCDECGPDDDSETDLGVAFDVGLDFEVSRQLALRAGIVLGDDNREAIGFSLAWRPGGLRGR